VTPEPAVSELEEEGSPVGLLDAPQQRPWWQQQPTMESWVKASGLSLSPWATESSEQEADGGGAAAAAAAPTRRPEVQLIAARR
jgi:hypothetical protein